MFGFFKNKKRIKELEDELVRIRSIDNDNEKLKNNLKELSCAFKDLVILYSESVNKPSDIDDDIE